MEKREDVSYAGAVNDPIVEEIPPTLRPSGGRHGSSRWRMTDAGKGGSDRQEGQTERQVLLQLQFQAEFAALRDVDAMSHPESVRQWTERRVCED